VAPLGEVKCPSKLILFGETAVTPGTDDYTEHNHGDRNHQGKENQLLLLGSAARRASEVVSPGGSRVKEGELQWAGFNMAGLLCLVLMVLKLALAYRSPGGVSCCRSGWCCGTTPLDSSG
jgi:hypothetical protein